MRKASPLSRLRCCPLLCCWLKYYSIQPLHSVESYVPAQTCEVVLHLLSEWTGITHSDTDQTQDPRMQCITVFSATEINRCFRFVYVWESDSRLQEQCGNLFWIKWFSLWDIDRVHNLLRQLCNWDKMRLLMVPCIKRPMAGCFFIFGLDLISPILPSVYFAFFLYFLSD